MAILISQQYASHLREAITEYLAKQESGKESISFLRDEMGSWRKGGRFTGLSSKEIFVKEENGEKYLGDFEEVCRYLGFEVEQVFRYEGKWHTPILVRTYIKTKQDSE